MTGILGRGSEAKKSNVVASLRYQTSQKGSVIPLVYGTARLAVNLLDYQNFQQNNGKGSKGGKGGVTGGGSGKTGSGSTNYTVDFAAGICQGPIQNYGLLWYNKAVTTLVGGTGISFSALGADGQATDSYWTANYSNNAINYSGTAFFTGDGYQLGASPALPNFNVEVVGIAAGETSPSGSFDANPADIVTDVLTNSRYGAGFPAVNLDSSGSIADYRAYCNAAGFMLAPVYDQQQPCSQMLAELAALTNSEVVWSAGLLKIIPRGDTALSLTVTPITFSGTVNVGDTLSLTFTGLPGGLVTLSHQLTQNDIVSYAAAGASLAMTITGNGTLADPGNSTLQAAGIYASVTPAGLLIFQTQGATVGISAGASGSETLSVGGTSAPYTWTPNTMPIYALGEDDFIVQESSVGTYLGVTPGGPALRMGAGPITGGFGDDPVHITRSTPADAMNMVQLEVTDRGTSYSTTITEAFDQGAIDLYGVRRDTSVKARAVVDPYFVASITAQLVLQRQLLYRNTYTFQLGWKYILLEPMDLVQITDPRLGANAITVRITAIEEDDEGLLMVTAEDWFGAPGGVLYPPAAPIAAVTGGIASVGQGGSTAMPLPRQVAASEAAQPNYGAIPSAVNPPVFVEPTAQLLAAQGQTSPYLIIGLSGGSGGAHSSIWGGANIYASLDGSTFSELGSVNGVSTMGVVTADCPSTGGLLAVSLTESDGALTSVSAANAAAATTLCGVVTPSGLLEFLSFTTATLTAPNQYTLSGLHRGLYGTSAIELPSGSQFLYLAGPIFTAVLPSQYVGHAVYFEFQSISITGAVEPLGSVAVYQYTPMGSSLIPGVFPVAVSGDQRVTAEALTACAQVEVKLQIEA
jgi:hypothetical protein